MALRTCTRQPKAAHVVQQRAGVSLKGGVGEVGDRYEQHADAVADLVVQGKPAESLLDPMAGTESAGGQAVQRRKPGEEKNKVSEGDEAPKAHRFSTMTDMEKRQVEDTLDACVALFHDIFAAQKAGVDDLYDLATQEIPPSIAEQILEAEALRGECPPVDFWGGLWQDLDGDI